MNSKLFSLPLPSYLGATPYYISHSLSAVMPFQTDDTWPAGLLTIFNHARVKHSTFENCYYGPYNKFLHYCFRESFTFYVTLQNLPRDDCHDTINPIVFLVVFNNNNKPVLIVEIKDDGWKEKAELRYRADEQMHGRYALMLDDCPLPCLWGISLLSTSAHVYCGDTATYQVQPPHIACPDPLHVLSPTFLAGDWDIDIMMHKGFQKMKEIVNDILAHTGN